MTSTEHQRDQALIALKACVDVLSDLQVNADIAREAGCGRLVLELGDGLIEDARLALLDASYLSLAHARRAAALRCVDGTERAA